MKVEGSLEMARKTNVTGIAKLSIGTTKNDRGYTFTRYIVNTETGKAKSFYFGKKTTQYAAFHKAVLYMKEKKIFTQTIAKAKAIYKEFNHENLL